MQAIRARRCRGRADRAVMRSPAASSAPLLKGMPPAPSPAEIREHIALSLQHYTKAYETEAVCDRLGMPPATEGAWAHNSKRVYVQSRLAGVDTTSLYLIARAVAEEFGDAELENLIAASGLHGADGNLKNLIFAAVGAKPRIVLRDAIDNVIEIVEGADRCLVYDRPLLPSGLSWGELVEWWAEASRIEDSRRAAVSLYRRLAKSLGSAPERTLFSTYCARYQGSQGRETPALVPQVYLHYDPYTKRELARFAGTELPRQRMDFLLLLHDRSRVVIEVDGRHHYADDLGTASPARYAAMVKEDRNLRLDGYEVYRFGARELGGSNPAAIVDPFFDRLLSRRNG
jgi:very-short-patch-repair endonuclease